MMTRKNNRFSLPSPSSFFGRRNGSFDSDDGNRPSVTGLPHPYHQPSPRPPSPSIPEDCESVSSSASRFRLRRSPSFRKSAHGSAPAWDGNTRFGGVRRTNSGLRSKQRVDNADIHDRRPHERDNTPAHEKPKFGLKQPPSYSIATAAPVAASSPPMAAAPPQSGSWNRPGSRRWSPDALHVPGTHRDADAPAAAATKTMVPSLDLGLPGTDEITYPSRGFVRNPQLGGPLAAASSPHLGLQDREGRPEMPFRCDVSASPSSLRRQKEEEQRAFYYQQQQQQYRELQQHQQYRLMQQQQQHHPQQRSEYQYQYRQSHQTNVQRPQVGGWGDLSSSRPFDAFSPTVAALPAPHEIGGQPTPAGADSFFSQQQQTQTPPLPPPPPSMSAYATTETTTTRQWTPPPPASRPSAVPSRPSGDNRDPVYVEIYPGVTQLLRGADETSRAADVNFVTPVRCASCTVDMLCIADAAYAICPLCRVVSPTAGQALNDQWGVGLGFVPPEDDPDAANGRNRSGYL